MVFGDGASRCRRHRRRTVRPCRRIRPAEAGTEAGGAGSLRADGRLLAAPLRQPHPVLPAGYSSPRGLPFGGDTERYPHSDEAIAHLLRYANQLDADIRTGRRVSEVRADGDGFALALEDGSRLPARAVVAATGSFGQPNRPTLSGLDSFTGTVLHVADDQAREPFAGQRIVVGGGNSAVQVQPNSLPTPASASPAGLRSSGSRSAHWAAKTCASGSRPPGWTSRRSAAFSALPPPWRSSTTVDTKRLSLRLHPIAARCSPASRAPR